MILFIRVRAENSVALNFPRRQPGPAKRHVMPGGAVVFEFGYYGWTSVPRVCVCMCFRIYATQVAQCLPRCYIGNLMTHVADIGQRTWQIQTDSTSMMVFLPGNENTTLKSSLTGHNIYTARAVPFFLSTIRGRRVWVPGLQRRFGVSHHDNLMTAWVLGPTQPDGQPCAYAICRQSRGPFVRSWPCSCPMLLQISSYWIHTHRTPGPRDGEHGITEPTGLARENFNR